MRINTKEQNEVRNAKRTDYKGVTFKALAQSETAAKEFGSYLTHLSPAGIRQAQVSINGKYIEFTSKANRKKVGRICHLIQLKGRALNVFYPGWITQSAYTYRNTNDLPTLRRGWKSSKKQVKATVKKTYKRTVTKVTRTRVPAWKRFLRWLAK